MRGMVIFTVKYMYRHVQQKEVGLHLFLGEYITGIEVSFFLF